MRPRRYCSNNWLMTSFSELSRSGRGTLGSRLMRPCARARSACASFLTIPSTGRNGGPPTGPASGFHRPARGFPATRRRRSWPTRSSWPPRLSTQTTGGGGRSISLPSAAISLPSRIWSSGLSGRRVKPSGSAMPAVPSSMPTGASWGCGSATATSRTARYSKKPWNWSSTGCASASRSSAASTQSWTPSWMPPSLWATPCSAWPNSSPRLAIP